MDLVDYYREIIPCSDKMIEQLKAPLPVCIWTNVLKITPEKLYASMQAEGYHLEPLLWCPHAFKVYADKSVGKCWQYFAGLFQVQEEVSMLPGVILAPKPGEKVLDLCAAPGNKTAQLSVAMRNNGTIVANDRNYSRLRALGQIMKRLGLINISTSVYDGVTYPSAANFFDKVLVDAPCSCQGTLRKGKNKKVIPDAARSVKMAAVQIGLLKKALQLCRPGGEILYSTCTFAPEENEGVISQLVSQFPDQVRVIPLRLDNFQFSAGCQSWQGVKYHPVVAGTMRVWPHQNDTGGFFVALLEKLGGARVEKIKIKKLHCDTQKVDDCLDIIDKRFDCRQLWQDYRFITGSQRGIYLSNRDNAPPAGIKLDATGLFALKTKTKFPKLTTGAAMLLGSQIFVNKIGLNQQQRDCYYQRKEMFLTTEQSANLSGMGYVLVTYEDCVLGTGLCFTAGEGFPVRLKSLFPKYLLGSGG